MSFKVKNFETTVLLGAGRVCWGPRDNGSRLLCQPNSMLVNETNVKQAGDRVQRPLGYS